MIPFQIADLFGTYLIAIREGDFWTYVFTAIILGAWVPYIVNKPQPHPRWSQETPQRPKEVSTSK